MLYEVITQADDGGEEECDEKGGVVVRDADFGEGQ